MRNRGDIWTGVTGIAFALLAVLLIIPLGRLLWASLLGDDGGFTLKHYRDFLAYPYYSRTIGHSFLVSGLVTLAALVVAVPVAFLLARVDIPGKAVLKSLAILPLVSPPFIGAYSWILLFGRAGYVTTLLQKVGLTIPTVYGMHGIVLALTLNLYPFVLLMLVGALQALDQSLEEAAQGLGSSPWRVFWTVTVPVTMPSVLGGALLVFLTAFADFGAPMIIGEGYQVLPTIVYSLFVNEMGGNPAMASTGATLLVLCTTAILLVQYWAVGRKRYAMIQLRPVPPVRPRPLVRGLLTGYAYLVIGLSLVPALVVAVTSFFESRGPVLYPNFSLGNYREVLFNVPRAIANSFVLSSVSTLLDVLLGTLIAYLVVRRRSLTTAALDSCVMIPYAIPGTVIGVAFIVAFNKPPIVLTGTFLILLLAYFVRRLPYSVRAGSAILHQIDPSVEEASISLGVSPLKSFAKVTARLMLPGIVSGGILTWVQTITEISATIFLYFGAWSTITVVIYRQVSSSNFGSAAAASTILLVAVFIPVLMVNWMMGERAVTAV
ncbi:MAG: iron ABC transporter permease [candidate division NC10 bacterium]|nr:iron ABC transporter permease [candidate division NC10 bacterium]MBI2457319.1 iron ABC transporter permease [candidate division NC10 bacterium]